MLKYLESSVNMCKERYDRVLDVSPTVAPVPVCPNYLKNEEKLNEYTAVHHLVGYKTVLVVKSDDELHFLE